jgi:hypothetical protein
MTDSSRSSSSAGGTTVPTLETIEIRDQDNSLVVGMADCGKEKFNPGSP